LVVPVDLLSEKIELLVFQRVLPLVLGLLSSEVCDFTLMLVVESLVFIDRFLVLVPLCLENFNLLLVLKSLLVAFVTLSD
jgi:hypothetical protein